MHGSVTAEPLTAPAGSSDRITFDLPAQALATAIEAYSVASGWQVIYDANLAISRQSAPVQGQFAPPVALRLLLAGSGLIPEFLAADGAVLVPDPSVGARQTPFEPAPQVRGYFGRLQAGLERMFCADPQIRHGAFRIALGVWIGSSGSVTHSALLGSTGQPEIDAAFDRAVRQLSVSQPPPTGLAQPVVILVTPELLAQCDVETPRQARAAR